MISQLIDSATFGFGASAGRDLYKSLKKNQWIWVLIGVALIAVGWRGLYMGVNRGAFYNFFVTFLGSLMMIIIGTGGFLAVGLWYSNPEAGAPLLIASAIVAVSTIGGNIWGLFARKKRVKALQLKKHNSLFMENIGLSDSDFDTNLLQDRDGNLLRLTEQSDKKIVFSLSGRRGYRAAIKMVDGKMIDYTGIVKI